MNKIIALVIVMLALASCSVQGTWNIKSVTAQGCYSDTNCAGYFSVPGKFSCCDATVEGTLKFSGKKEGTFTEDITITAKCPGEKAYTQRVLNENLKYRIYKKNGKTYIYFQKSNKTHQLILGEDNLALVSKGYMDAYVVQDFMERGLKPPAYILLRYSCTRQKEESNGQTKFFDVR